MLKMRLNPRYVPSNLDHTIICFVPRKKGYLPYFLPLLE